MFGDVTSAKGLYAYGGDVYGDNAYVRALYNNSSSAVTIDNNTFSEIIGADVCGGMCYGTHLLVLQQSGTGTVKITNNTFKFNQSGGGLNDAYAIAMTPSGNSSGHNIDHNKIQVPIFFGAGNDASNWPDDNAIMIAPGGTISGTIIGNKITDYGNAYSPDNICENSPYITGIELAGNGWANTWTVANNEITLSDSLGSGQNSIVGIMDELASNSTVNYYYNTVYISGTQSGSCFGTVAFWRAPNYGGVPEFSTGTGSLITLRNNIFINNRTGGVGNWAIMNDTKDANWLAGCSDYNFFGASNANKLCQFNNVNKTLSGWQAALNSAGSGGDANSSTATLTTGASNFTGNNLNPVSLFINPSTVGNLDIKITDGQSYQFADNMGTPVSITSDYDLDLRNGSNPDIGADEFCTSGTVSPSITSPSGITSTSFNATWNPVVGAGGYYLDVATDSTFSSILPSYAHLNVGNVISYPVTGLSNCPSYWYRIKPYGVNPCLSGYSSNLIQVDLTGSTRPIISVQPTSQSLCLGTSFTVSVTASPATSYQWYKNGAVISGATGTSYNKASVVSPDAASYTCVITNSGCSVTSNAAVLTVLSNTSPVFYYANLSTNNQLAFNNAYINTTQPVFSVSSTHASGSYNAIKIEISTSSTFGSINFTQTFTGSYTSGNQYDLTFNTLGLSNNTTYYVRAYSACDGGTSWGPASTGTQSFTYTTTVTSTAPEWRQVAQAQFSTWTANSSVISNGSSITINGPVNNVGDMCLASGTGWSTAAAGSSGAFHITYGSTSSIWAATGGCTSKGDLFANGSTSSAISSGSYAMVQQQINLTNVSQLTWDFDAYLLRDAFLPSSSLDDIPANAWEYDVYVGGTQSALDGTKLFSVTHPATAITTTGASLNYPHPGNSISTTSFSGPTWVKFVLKNITGHWLNGSPDANGEVDYFIDNVAALGSALPGSFTSTPASLSSLENSNAWSTFKWNQTLNGGTVTFKIQKSADGNTWTDAITNITSATDGAQSYDISLLGGGPDVAQIRAVGNITYGSSSPVLVYFGFAGVTCVTPTITLSNNPVAATANVCFSAGSQTANFNYSGTTGSPTTYSISGWSGGSFVNITNAALPASPIPVTVPANAAVGTYTATLTVAAGSCVSSNSVITVKVLSNSSSTDTHTACDSYIWHGATYAASNNTDVFHTTTAAGCDSAIMLNLTISHSSASGTSVTSCDSYVWNSSTYTTGGAKTFHSTNASGCDSLATLNLTIKNSSASSTSVTTCGSYVWNGSTYTASGTFTYSTINAAGCDSLATLNLTITGACSVNYTVNLFLQGYYIGTGHMSPLLHMLGAPSTTVVDTVTIELHNSGGAHAMAYSYTGTVNNTGSIACAFPNGALTGTFFVVVKHRNSVETWSASAQFISIGGSYSFTSGAGQAYGSNLVNLGSGVYGIYGGDINQDGAVNATDRSTLQSALSSFVIGVYDINDINGDGIVDQADYRILQNNVPHGITVQHP